MKPEARSKNLLAVTRAKAKMYEYNVPEEAHINIVDDPAKLFILAIGILGDLSGEACRSDEAVLELIDNVKFSAHFFDSYYEAKLNTEIGGYLLLLGATAYYLCNLPGSSHVLIDRIQASDYLSHASDPECMLCCLLARRFSAPVLSEHSIYGSHFSLLSVSFSTFRTTGEEGDITEQLHSLRELAHSFGSARDLLLIDAICAVVKKRLANSVWNCLPQYSCIPANTWQSAITKRTFIKEFWPAQRLLGEHGIFLGRSAIVQMPTSAGKTRAAELIIRSSFLANRSSLAVIVAPFRALCHEIHNTLRRQFAGEPITVSELSDVIQKDFELQELLGDRQVIVVTPEKLNYVLRQEPELANRIKLIIYDEGHLFDDYSRGVTYELLLSSLKTRLPEDAQSILISAVVSNADDINRWLLGGGGEVVSGTSLLPTYRTLAFTSWASDPGRLQFIDPDDPIGERGFFVPRVLYQHKLELKPRERNDRVFPERNSGTDIALYLALKLAGNGCVAIFTGKKDSASKLCDDLVEKYERKLPIDPPSVYSNPDEIIKLRFIHEANFGSDAPTTIAASLGVFMHHGNTPQGIRLSVEYALQKGLARCVICTSTLAQGVNLPLRYLIVSGIRQNQDLIKTRDFHNLIGRAGRSGMHTEGSIIFANPEIYDHKNVRSESWRWREALDLLNPANSESCSSHLFTLFEPLRNARRDRYITLEPVQLIDRLLHNPEYIDTMPEKIVSQLPDGGYDAKGLKEQINSKRLIIADIESYLMANLLDDSLQDDALMEAVDGLVTETLAFSLANEEQKQFLKDSFRLLATYLIQTEPSAEKRQAFSKTLLGMTECRELETWLDENQENLERAVDQELLELLWPLLRTYIKNPSFRGCNSEEVLKTILAQWVQGIPFHEMLVLLEDVRIGSRKPKIQHVVDICENGFGFDGSLILGAIAQLLEYTGGDEASQTMGRLAAFQKRLKYGLSLQHEVAIYELGFADRPLASELARLLSDVEPSRSAILNAFQENERGIRSILSKYPSYFTVHLNAML